MKPKVTETDFLGFHNNHLNVHTKLIMSHNANKDLMKKQLFFTFILINSIYAVSQLRMIQTQLASHSRTPKHETINC